MNSELQILWLVPSQGLKDFFSSFRKALKNFGINIEIVYLREAALRDSIGSLQNQILQIASSKDIVFFYMFPDTVELDDGFLDRLHSAKPTVLVGGDEEIYFESNTKYYLNFFDGMICNDLTTVKGCSEMGKIAFYHPLQNLNCENFVYRNSQPKANLFFVGNHEIGERGVAIEHLKSNDVSIQSYGKGSQGGYITNEKYWSILSGQNIVLNFTKATKTGFAYFDSIRSTDDLRQIKGRPFECFACGSLVVTEYHPDLEEIFKAETFFVVFDHYTDIPKILEHLKQSPHQISKKIKEAREYYLKNFSSAVLAQQIITMHGQIVSHRKKNAFKDINSIEKRPYLLKHLRLRAYIIILRDQTFQLNIKGAFDTCKRIVLSLFID